jgi:hypothetical protein
VCLTVCSLHAALHQLQTALLPGRSGLLSPFPVTQSSPAAHLPRMFMHLCSLQLRSMHAYHMLVPVCISTDSRRLCSPTSRALPAGEYPDLPPESAGGSKAILNPPLPTVEELIASHAAAAAAAGGGKGGAKGGAKGAAAAKGGSRLASAAAAAGAKPGAAKKGGLLFAGGRDLLSKQLCAGLSRKLQVELSAVKDTTSDRACFHAALCHAVLCYAKPAGDAPAAGATLEVATSSFIPLIEGAVAEYIAKWQERPAPRGTAQQVKCCIAFRPSASQENTHFSG